MKNLLSRTLSVVLLISLTLTVLIFEIQPVQAATIIVTTLNDEDDGAGALGTPGDISLREAVLYSAANDTITFDAALNGGTITLTLGEITLNKNLTITGPGANQLSISGNNSTRIFNVTGTPTLDISGLTLRQGSSGFGGAIYTTSAIGGTLTLNDIYFLNNTVTGNGGAIHTNIPVIIQNSAFTGNSTPTGLSGGAISVRFTSVDLINVSFSGNSGDDIIGPFFATINLYNVTIANNSASDTNLLVIDSSTVNVTHTIFDNNSGDNCRVSPSSTLTIATSLSDDNTCLGATQSSTINLMPLANYGGTTDTFALGGGSSAIDGSGAPCPAQTGGIDQRGTARDGNCDIGAFEATNKPIFSFENLSAVANEATTNPIPVRLSMNGTGRAYGTYTANLTYNNVTTTAADYSTTVNISFNCGAAGCNTDQLGNFNQTAVGDALLELTERVTINLNTPSNGSTINAGRQNFDLDITDATAATAYLRATTDAAEPATNGLFTLELLNIGNAPVTNATGGPLNFTYTLGGSATPGAGNDYATLPTPLNLPNNQSSVTFPVTVQDDVLVESTETIILTLTAPSPHPNLALDTTPATVNITDDESATLQFVTPTGSISEAAGSYSTDVQYIGPALIAGQQITFDVIRTNGSATSPGDYTSTTTSHTFNGPLNSGDVLPVTTPILDDLSAEPAEDFTLTLNNVVTTPTFPVTLVNNPQTVTIVDNDSPGVTLLATGGNTSVLEDGSNTDTYTLQLNTDPAAAVTITITVSNGQCQVTPATLTFTPSAGAAPWNVPQTITVRGIEDNGLEPNPHNCFIGHTTTSADPVYNGLSVPFSSHVVDNEGETAVPVANIGIFDPALSKIGFLVPGQVGVTGEQLEWIVTVTNNGTAPGTNIQITDTIDSRLQVDRVETPVGQAVIAGQTVVVTIPTLAPGQVAEFSIFTTVLRGVSVSNTACLTADNTAQRCTTGLAVQQLPATGESPWWRPLLLSLLLVGLSALLVFRKRMMI